MVNPMVEDVLVEDMLTMNKPLYSYNFCALIDNRIDQDGRVSVAENAQTSEKDELDFVAPANIAMMFQMQGRCIGVTSACSTGTDSIGEAYQSVQTGQYDVMLAGGSDAIICPFQ